MNVLAQSGWAHQFERHGQGNLEDNVSNVEDGYGN